MSVCSCFLFLCEKRNLYSFDPACSKPPNLEFVFRIFPPSKTVEMGTHFGTLGRFHVGECVNLKFTWEKKIHHPRRHQTKPLQYVKNSG